jgi:predicted nucleotidyltransferase
LEYQVIDNVPNLPNQKRLLLEHIVDRLNKVVGVTAIVLGGSYANGTHHEASDMDIGLYYSEARPFSIADIRRIAEDISVNRAATVTGFHEWGAWVNGGAWIHTSQGKVDFLYRNSELVEQTIAEAQQGVTHHDYDQQPAYGFYSVMYLAETQICIPLYDPESLIAKLKRSVEVYPPLLKQKVIADSLWAAEFTLLHARGFAAQGDIYNTVGCLTRAISNITQTLFALNEKYFLRDKKVLDVVSQFSTLPSGYIQEINRILACPGSTAQELTKTVSDLEQVWRSVVSLDGVDYKPKFQM